MKSQFPCCCANFDFIVHVIRVGHKQQTFKIQNYVPIFTQPCQIPLAWEGHEARIDCHSNGRGQNYPQPNTIPSVYSLYIISPIGSKCFLTTNIPYIQAKVGHQIQFKHHH